MYRSPANYLRALFRVRACRPDKHGGCLARANGPDAWEREPWLIGRLSQTRPASRLNLTGLRRHARLATSSRQDNATRSVQFRANQMTVAEERLAHL